jgi:hypothetical protein
VKSAVYLFLPFEDCFQLFPVQEVKGGIENIEGVRLGRFPVRTAGIKAQVRELFEVRFRFAAVKGIEDL